MFGGLCWFFLFNICVGSSSFVLWVFICVYCTGGLICASCESLFGFCVFCLSICVCLYALVFAVYFLFDIFIYCFCLDFLVAIFIFSPVYWAWLLWRIIDSAVFKKILLVLFHYWFTCALFFWRIFLQFIKVLVYRGINCFVRHGLFVDFFFFLA